LFPTELYVTVSVVLADEYSITLYDPFNKPN